MIYRFFAGCKLQILTVILLTVNMLNTISVIDRYRANK